MKTVMSRSLIESFLYTARNLRSRALFAAIDDFCRGKVLDVGGWDFYKSVAERPRVSFTQWVSLDNSPDRQPSPLDERCSAVVGDGCNMPFADEEFDTVLNVQVLEHVFRPFDMLRECVRVLKPGGVAILLVPQTSMLHMAPHHYYNFTKFWIAEAAGQTGLSILYLKPLGGFWSSMASRLVYFFLTCARQHGSSTAEDRRNAWFYLMLPFMCVFAVLCIPVCMLFSLGDLTEEPNNHLCVARKLSETR